MVIPRRPARVAGLSLLALLGPAMIAAAGAQPAARSGSTPAAQSSDAAATPARAGGVASYDAFTRGATAQRGLFTIWHKDGKVYLEVHGDQVGRDYVQTIVPATGLGGRGVVWGNTDHLPTELFRWEDAGGALAIIWPNPYFIAPGDAAAQRAIDLSFPRSIVGLAPIVARDASNGTVIVDAAPFLDDQLNLKRILGNATGRRAGSGRGGDAYALDRAHSYFGSTKAFPKNVVLHALQAWDSDTQRLEDVPPDPRHLQIRVVYNIAEAPASPDYRPRLADDRVGTYADVYLQFNNDEVLTRKLRYVVRWNVQASDPSKPLSPAKHPMVFYLSNTIPERHRAAIRDGVLAWNAAFEKIGISGALEVRDQPDDPNWDPDDIRYNVLRWVPETRASFGADSQTLYDPRTGEEFRTGILISSDVPLGAVREWRYLIDPVRFGRVGDPMPPEYLRNKWKAVILHETGHNLGMQHNFIGSMAYTAKQLQDPAFTAKNGIVSTVMEYTGLNLWPRPYGQGDYQMTVLGPYDYYFVKWTYAPVPGAVSPEAEVPVLSKWAEAWSDPRYRYASDEDVSWSNGHAADPRVETGDLTDDPIGWCQVQLKMNRDLLVHLGSRYPAPGEAYEAESNAFSYLFARYRNCALLPARFIGGQYVSRAHRGDPHAAPPVVPVPRSEQHRAFAALERDLFADSAFPFSPSLLQQLGYSEWAGYGYDIPEYGNLPAWAYRPPERHDLPVADLVLAAQMAAIDQMFQPLVLERLAATPALSTAGGSMHLADLFDWLHAAIFSEVRLKQPRISTLRRALQAAYAQRLSNLATAPPSGAPSDARALAAADLARFGDEVTRALKSSSLEALTRAHLLRLKEIAAKR